MKPRRTAYLAPTLLGSLLLAACAPANQVQDQSMVDPVGEAARAVNVHWLTMLWVGTAVFLIVMALSAVAVVRRSRAHADEESTGSSDPFAQHAETGPDTAPAGRRWTLFVAVGGGVIPALIILGITAQSLVVSQQVDPGAAGDDATVVEVTGHQFWWEVRYPDSGVVTANEVHIPTGERVRLEITTGDVIHSLWVPQLSGKTDMIPGTANTMWLQTDEPGIYWGQCAEFCGVQHAQMRLAVVAHEPDEFDGWLTAHTQPAADPGSTAVDEDDLVAQGREVFMSSSCVYCHAIAGTEAQSDFGPDLTHLASRQTLAAGMLPNNRGNLAGWILDPQSIKPGNLMPGTDISGAELQALLVYLESLE